MEANAAMKRHCAQGHGRELSGILVRLAETSGTKTPTQAELIAPDRRRQGEKTSNRDCNRPRTGQRAKPNIKNGRTHMVYKPGHVVDLESPASVSALIHPADQGDTTSREIGRASCRERV